MKRFLLNILIITCFFSLQAFAETPENEKDFWGNAGDWLSGAASDAWEWTSDTAADVGDWVSDTATDVSDWVTGTASDVWQWTADVTTGAWNGVAGFFDPPSTEGNPNIPAEPALPEGTLKMYLGYEPIKTGLHNGYSGEKTIGRNDPHFGLTLGKFYVSGFTSALSYDKDNFVFLKTVGDNLELHFELVQDIDMLDGDTFVSINSDNGGYDKHFGISPTYFGRGTLIVRHTDYQNNAGEPQVYTDYLTAKMTGEADTVISLNEEGDYEVALDYEIKEISYILGTKATQTNYSDYKLFFHFSVRNGNCMVFPFDVVTKEELKNTAFAENGFYLDLAYSRYLDINVRRSVLVETSAGVTEDIRFNRPARDGEKYTDEGIYTITVKNNYTGEETTKTLYVGADQRMIDYITQGLTIDQIISAIDHH